MRYRALLAALLAVCLGFLTACSSAPSEKDLGNLTYDQIVNTGLANKCLTLPESARGSIALESGKKYELIDLCLEPTAYFVKEEPVNKRGGEAEFVPAKVLTRKTSSLDQVYGDLTLTDSGIKFDEQGGMDFQAITVLLPGGEEVPFLFTLKGLVANADTKGITTSTDLRGEYRVPSYRTSNFLDPKGRGLTTGYQSAVGIVPAGDEAKLSKENTKRFVVGTGNVSLAITKVDSSTGEVAGVFEAVQPSDTDMGGKEAVDVKIQGQFYGRVDTAA
jgi:photosystem II oxygen-evolving enhancer protein 1